MIQDEIRIAQGKFTVSEIVEICKKEVDENGEVVLLERFTNPLIKEKLDSAVSVLSNDLKYKLDITPINKKWVIRKNPSYKSKWFEYKLAVFTGLITLGISILIWKLDRQSTSQELKAIKIRLEKIESEKK